MKADSKPLSSFWDAYSRLTESVPLSWQERLFCDHFRNGDIPSALDIPTGLGKTSVMAVWLIVQAWGAHLPRRLVYVV